MAILFGGIAAVPSGSSCSTRNLVFHEGTNIAATVSPDGQTVIMDLQNNLWSLPIKGGRAEKLTDDFLELHGRTGLPPASWWRSSRTPRAPSTSG